MKQNAHSGLFVIVEEHARVRECFGSWMRAHGIRALTENHIREKKGGAYMLQSLHQCVGVASSPSLPEKEALPSSSSKTC